MPNPDIMRHFGHYPLTEEQQLRQDGMKWWFDLDNLEKQSWADHFYKGRDYESLTLGEMWCMFRVAIKP